MHLQWTVPRLALKQPLAFAESSTGSIFHDTQQRRINLQKKEKKRKKEKKKTFQMSVYLKPGTRTFYTC